MPARRGRAARCYLTGVDWIVHGLDCMSKRATGVGNTFVIVIEVEAVLREGEVREYVNRVTRKYPVVNGTVRRHYNLAPYWKMPSATRGAPAEINVHYLKRGADAAAVLEKAANTGFRRESEHLAFHLIITPEGSQVAVTFDHRLFDAHGAEAFLGLLQQEWENGGSVGWVAAVAQGANLNHWGRKLAAGKRVNRAFLRLGGAGRVLPLARRPVLGGARFRVVSLSGEQSQGVMERAEREAGYLMAMPFALAVAVESLHGVFASRGTGAGDYVIPVTVDSRTAAKAAQEVFFNHVSFLMFRIRPEDVEVRSSLLRCIKEQMYEQVRSGLAQDIREASFLMRIAPLGVMSYVLRRYLKGEMASFCFSFLRETRQVMNRFMGTEVRRSYHMPRVPMPPGLGVFFQETRGALSVYLSYTEGVLAEGEVDTIVESLKCRLVG